MLALIIYTLVFFSALEIFKMFLRWSEINSLEKDITNIYRLIASKSISVTLGQKVIDDLELQLKRLKR